MLKSLNQFHLEHILGHLAQAQVVGVSGKFLPVDLSAANTTLSGLKNAADFEGYIEKLLAENNAAAAWGGYNEARNLYKRSDLFSGPGQEERDIHIGIDIWIKAGTPVLAALDGTVHSFNYNTGIGNYGPTIILRHEISGMTFFTLYGHLSLESIENIEIGDPLKKGAVIGSLGSASVNGDYAPHLHFQIIKNISGYFGDYPGVCNKNDRAYFLENCPDPNLLLKLKQ